MDISDRLFNESPLFQGIDEVQAYSFLTTAWGVDAPVAGTAFIFNEAGTDVGTINFGGTIGGTATVSGSTITMPIVQNLTAGVKYKLFCSFSSTDGQVKKPWTWLYGQDFDSGGSRIGMRNLVRIVRQLTNADTHEMEINGEVYWSDSDIQTVLDRHSMRVIEKDLEFVSQYETGTTIYKILPTGFTDWEEPTSGNTRWVLRDHGGTVVGTANYTYDKGNGIINFTSDQGGTVNYNLTAYTYDKYAAAADLLEWRMANFMLWYNFRSENQSLNRSDAFKQVKSVHQFMKSRVGTNTQGAGDLRTGTWDRGDVVSFNG